MNIVKNPRKSQFTHMKTNDNIAILCLQAFLKGSGYLPNSQVNKTQQNGYWPNCQLSNTPGLIRNGYSTDRSILIRRGQ